jgi:hypothetical protein
MAATLQVVGQQHYGAGQDYLFAPGDTHRLSRPLSGTLPAIQVSGSGIFLTPGSRSIANGEQSGPAQDDGKLHRGQEGEQAQRSHQGRHDS